VGGRFSDAVYGTAPASTWPYLERIAQKREIGRGRTESMVDLGIDALPVSNADDLAPLVAPRADAPVVLPPTWRCGARRHRSRPSNLADVEGLPEPEHEEAQPWPASTPLDGSGDPATGVVRARRCASPGPCRSASGITLPVAPSRSKAAMSQRRPMRSGSDLRDTWTHCAMPCPARSLTRSVPSLACRRAGTPGFQQSREYAAARNWLLS
jgi:hypothetical protein